MLNFKLGTQVLFRSGFAVPGKLHYFYNTSFSERVRVLIGRVILTKIIRLAM